MANMPFVSGKVAQTALQAGLADDSFGMGYKSEADRQLQKAQADAKLAELIKGKELEQQAVAANMEMVKREAESQGLKPGKYSMQASATGGGFNPESDSSKLAMFLGQQDKLQDNKRLETKALQDEYNRLIGKTPEQVQGIEEALKNIQKPSTITKRTLQSNLARAYDTGALSNRDVEDATGGLTAKGAIAGIANFFGADMDPYTDAQKKAIYDMLESRKKAATTRLSASQKELNDRSAVLAPTLASTGELEPTVQSLGSRMSSTSTDPRTQDPRYKSDPKYKRMVDLLIKAGQ